MKESKEVVAIDFETANEKLSSACSLGIAVIKDYEIVKTLYWLIRPPELYFRPFNVMLHGISEEIVEKKPEFYRIWPVIKKQLEGKIVIAHNALFDISVLKSLLNVYQIDYPELNYACTVNLARKVWIGLNNYKLNTISEYLNIEFIHHNACEDAKACAHIAIEAARKINACDFNDLFLKTNTDIKKLKRDSAKIVCS
jgi:DNA polymerase-3 subunit epsilon